MKFLLLSKLLLSPTLANKVRYFAKSWRIIYAVCNIDNISPVVFNVFTVEPVVNCAPFQSMSIALTAGFQFDIFNMLLLLSGKL